MVLLKAWMAPNVVANVSSDHSTSNGLRIMSGDALEPELWPFQVRPLSMDIKVRIVMTISFQELPGPMFLKQPDFNIVFFTISFRKASGPKFFKQDGANIF